VDTPEGRLAAPLGLYRTDLLVRWINDLFGWLESHHAALRIERAYLFSTIPVRELWATAPAGIGLFDPTTAALTPMGQAYRARALGSPVPTPAPCAPRPPVQVITRAGGGGRLQVTLASQSGSSGALQALRFGSATNAVIEVGGDASTPGTVSREGNFSLTLPPGTTRVDFFVRQVTSGAATTVPVVAVDGCGDWPTFVGGGPEAFVSSTGTAIPAGPAGVVPTPGPSPTAGTRCTSEPAVQVRTVAGGGALQVVVSGTGDVRLLALRFTSMSNGLVDVGDHRAMASSFSVPLAAGSQQASFVVRRCSECGKRR